MGRHKKGQALQERIDRYLDEYELDDLNQANDMAALTQMCQLELNMEQIQDALSKVKSKEIIEDSKRIRDLVGALRDATQSWTNLQTELGIARRKRRTESDETPLQYIEKLQEQAKKIIDLRFKKLTCDCGQALGKFMFYVTEKGESGSIESNKKGIVPYKYTVRCECWKCGDIAEISNEDIVLVQR